MEVFADFVVSTVVLAVAILGLAYFRSVVGVFGSEIVVLAEIFVLAATYF